MNDDGLPRHVADTAARDRRRIPSVGDLVEAMARETGIPPERKGELYHAAHQICAEELRMVRTGFEPAPLADLVDRAVRLLPAELGGDRFRTTREWDEDAPFSEEPLEAGKVAYSPDDPFRLETAAPGEMEEPEPLEPPEDAVEESPEEPIAFATRDLTSPPSRGGRFSVFLLIVAIGGGMYFFARSKRIPSPATPGSAAPGPDVTAPVSSPFEGTSSSVIPAGPVPGRSTSELPAEPSARATAAAPPPIPESHGSSMVSSDWTGPAAAYMIHFSSFQKKENAERDAARLGKLMGRPLHVIAVNLGKDGMWFRVMLGDFSSREEAQAFREGLAANGTAGMGLVYRVSAPQAE